MDFQSLALPDAGAAGINADALIAVLTAEGDLPRLARRWTRRLPTR